MQSDEKHKAHRVGWLRAAVLGANDGIVSTASLVLGVAAAGAASKSILITGIAGLFAGSLSMAAGEYVSVSSQSDTEKADLELERRHLAADPDKEHAELASVYIDRGLDPKLVDEVAKQLMDHDALGAHARDELGFSHKMSARPLHAAAASAVSFAIGAALPLSIVLLLPLTELMWGVSICSLLFLAILGIVAARVGRASMLIAAVRVTVWGALAMALTAGVGALFGRVV